MKLLHFTLIMTFLLTACASGPFVFQDMRIREGITSGQIRIGCTQQDVLKVQGIRIMPYCTKSKITADGQIDLWDFATKMCGVNLNESYALIFKNGLLIEIRTVKNQLDLQI